MKFVELIRSVIDGEVVKLGQYEVLVSKALREITGGVEVYDIQVEDTASGERDVFKTFEAFANEDCNIANNFKCNSCGEYIDRPDGFYVDNEMFGTFYDTLVNILGLDQNSYSGSIQSVITLDDLFM